MRQIDDEQRQVTPREKKLRELRSISWWQGNKKRGEWATESVATTVERTFERHTNGVSEEGEKAIVRERVTEIVYAHHGYRPKFEDEKKTRKAFFFRGARIWRD